MFFKIVSTAVTPMECALNHPPQIGSQFMSSLQFSFLVKPTRETVYKDRGLRPECPGSNSVPLLTTNIVFGHLLHLSVSAVPLWVGGSPADSYPMRVL